MYITSFWHKEKAVKFHSFYFQPFPYTKPSSFGVFTSIVLAGHFPAISYTDTSELYDSVSGTIALSHLAAKKWSLASALRMMAIHGECKVWTSVSGSQHAITANLDVSFRPLISIHAITANLDVSFRPRYPYTPSRPIWTSVSGPYTHYHCAVSSFKPNVCIEDKMANFTTFLRPSITFTKLKTTRQLWTTYRCNFMRFCTIMAKKTCWQEGDMWTQ